jgi:hypothetical protein
MPPPPGHSSTQRAIAMTRKDCDDFSRLLLETFPNIRFLSRDYWEYFKDNTRKWVYLAPPNLRVPYLSSLAADEARLFRIWLEPDGWQPEWEQRRAFASIRTDGPIFYSIMNEPRLSFYFDRSIFPPPTATLREGRIWAVYDKTDKEHIALVRKVYRLSEKVTSNWLIGVHPDGSKWWGPKRDSIWAGHDALEWCRADPRRCLGVNRRPPLDTDPPAPPKRRARS